MLIRSVVLVIAFVGAAACTTSPAPAAGSGPVPVAATTALVSTTDWPGVIEAGGTLAGRETALVAARVVAGVRRVTVQAGDPVQAGQLLVELDDDDVAASAQAAEASVVSAERGVDRARADLAASEAAAALAAVSYDRMVNLAERRSATLQELDAARAANGVATARVAAVKAALAEAEAELDRRRADHDGASARMRHTRIVAPFDGIVTERLIETGDMASPGLPLLRVETTAALEAVVRLDESRARTIRTGARVDLIVDDGGVASVREGRITEIGRAALVDARAVEIRVAVTPSTGLRPGSFVRVRMPAEVRRVLSVPDSAIVRHGQLASVFVVDAGVARSRLVRLGAVQAGRIEVVAGLVDGDRIVVTPVPAIRDGVPVTESRSADAGGGR